MGVAFYDINLLCWTLGKYLIINAKEQNQEDVVAMEDDEKFQYKGLEDNEVITLSPPSPRIYLCAGWYDATMDQSVIT